MHRRAFLLSLLVVTAASSPSDGCAPCPSQLDVRATVRAAKAIVVAEAVKVPPTPLDPTAGDGPASIELRVFATKKGAPLPEIVRVRSFYGLCPFGIQLPAGRFLVFLGKDADGSWTSVAQGCAVRSLSLVEGRVVEKEISYSVDEWLQKILRGDGSGGTSAGP